MKEWPHLGLQSIPWVDEGDVKGTQGQADRVCS